MTARRWYRSTVKHLGNEVLLCTEPNQPMITLSVTDEHSDDWQGAFELRQLHYSMITALASYLNEEGPRPTWIDEYHRVTEDVAIHPTLGNLVINGPKVSTNRVTDCDSMTPEDKDKRARLMDFITLVR